MRKVVFVGASNVAGDGWDLSNPKDAACFWVYRIHRELPEFSNTELAIKAKSGASNESIFSYALDGLLNENAETLFCSWVSYPRFTVEVGYELYDTFFHFPSNITNNINLNSENYTKEYINDIKNRFATLIHPCQEIFKIIRYANALTKIGKLTNTRVIHINDSCAWDKNFFNYLDTKDLKPSNLTKYTQEILLVNNRCDEEIFKLYNKLHSDFNNAGGIDENNWLNLYNSFKKLKVDTNHDNIHPGKLSGNNYIQLVKNFLKS